MATVESPSEQKVTVKEMSWDPVTRIVGSLGIHTEIDFTNRKVNKCYSTSMIFRGFDIFMKGIDPRDAHFITSRICGICGDNHCTCSCLNQNMAYSVKPPPLGDLAFNLAESADFMFDHAIFNDCMANVDYSEQVVKETNPGLLKTAEETSAPHSDIHGYKGVVRRGREGLLVPPHEPKELATAIARLLADPELRAAMSLARLWQQQGKRDEGRRLLAPIYGWFTEGFDTPDLQEAKVLLEALT